MSFKTEDGVRSLEERTHKIEIIADKRFGVRVRIHREVIEKINDHAEKTYRAVGIKDYPGFRPVIELSGPEIIAAANYEWKDKDGVTKIFDPEDLYHVISAFCDSMCKKWP